VIGDALAKFRHDLKVFQAFEIHTCAIAGTADFFEHRFVRKGQVIGVVAVRVVLKTPDHPVDPQVLLAGLAHSALSPELPEWAKRFDQGAELLGELVRDEERSKGIGQDSICALGQKRTLRNAIAAPALPPKAAFAVHKSMSAKGRKRPQTNKMATKLMA